MLTCWIDDSKKQDSLVLTQTLIECESMPTSRPMMRLEIEICQEIWNCLQSAWVVIPYGTRIKFSSSVNRRNPDMLIDLIRAYAVLRQMQRNRETVDGMQVVFADLSDFEAAACLFDRINSECGAQSTKLTRQEADLITAIRDMGFNEITITQMQLATGWSNSRIYKLLHGYMSRGVTYSGLLEKCPAISYTDRTVITGTDGATMHRRTRAYTWDEILYLSWSVAGTVWLSDDEGSLESDSNPPPSQGHDSDLNSTPESIRGIAE
ncbi:MAG TPA: hypothetical protein VN429_10835, partial [Methanospirillum sp.]|nr:hypothetical protein [Methanospirillum sp.]